MHVAGLSSRAFGSVKYSRKVVESQRDQQNLPSEVYKKQSLNGNLWDLNILKGLPLGSAIQLHCNART